MAMDGSGKLSFRAVEVFCAVVEQGGVIAAARQLGASPSAVSLQLSNLENALDAKLLERSAQRFALTEAGELFHPRAMRILDEVSAARAALSTSKVSPRMVLKLAIVEDFDAQVVSPWIGAIREVYPNIRFHVKSGPSHESHEALGNRSADIIVAVEAIDSVDWIEEHPVLNDPYILVCSKAAAKARTLEALMEFPFIRYSREQLMGRQVEAHLRRNKCVPPREHEFSSNQMVFSMVEAQAGWTLASMAAFASVPGIETVLEAAPLPVPAFDRRIALYARKHALGDLPSRLAMMLRIVLETSTVVPIRERLAGVDVSARFKIID